MKLNFGLMANIDCMTGFVSLAGQMAGIFYASIRKPYAIAKRKNASCFTSLDKCDRSNLSKYGRLLDAFVLKIA